MEFKALNYPLVSWPLMKRPIKYLEICFNQSLKIFIPGMTLDTPTSLKSWPWNLLLLKSLKRYNYKRLFLIRSLISSLQLEEISVEPHSHLWWQENQNYKLKGRLLKYWANCMVSILSYRDSRILREIGWNQWECLSREILNMMLRG